MSKDINQIKIKAPTSIALVYEVYVIGRTNQRAAAGAALGLCFDYIEKEGGHRTHKKPAGDKYGNLTEYGFGIIDQFVGRGYSYGDLLTKGTEAYNLCLSILPTDDEVKAEQGN